MIRHNLPTAVCLAVLASACSRLPAQTAPADQPPPAAQTAPTPAPSPANLPPVSLAAQIADLVNDPAVARYHWGIMVTNLDGGLIYGLNQGQLFQPASNTKLFTTTTALALLGPKASFDTTVQITAKIGPKGVLKGDLQLVGGGDANFGTHNIPYIKPADRPKTAPPPETSIADIDDLADQVVAKGIRTIEGNILGNDMLLAWNPYPDNWSWDDLLWGYGAPVSALTIHDNQIDVSVAPGSGVVSVAPGSGLAIVSTAPDLPYYAITNFVATQDGGKRNCDAIRYTRAPGSKEIHIAGDIPARTEPCTEHVAIQDPAEYAALALKAALEKRGVRITGTARAAHSFTAGESTGPPSPSDSDFEKLLASPGSPSPCKTITLDGPEPTVIARHRSPTLIDDIVYTAKVSQNLHAELLLRNLGERITCEDSARVSLHVERLFLQHAGLDPSDFVFNDGSGLSTHDLVTPRATAKLLQFATTQPWFADWKAALPVGGEDGTLGGRFAKPPLKDHLFAKTGTLGEARALSGYLDAASGRTVIFSIMVDNHLPGTTADRDTMDKIVAAIQAAE